MSSVVSDHNKEMTTAEKNDELVNKSRTKLPAEGMKACCSTDFRSKMKSFAFWILKKIVYAALYSAFYFLLSNVLAYRAFPMLQRELQKFPQYQSISPDVIFSRFWEWVAFYHCIQWVDNIVSGGRLQKFVKENMKFLPVQLTEDSK